MYTPPLSSQPSSPTTPAPRGDLPYTTQSQPATATSEDATPTAKLAPDALTLNTPQAGQQFEWLAPYAAIPPVPPLYGGMPPAGKPKRPRWSALLMALVLLAMLGVGAAAGAAIASARASSMHTVVIGATSAPATTLSSSVSSLQQSEESVIKAVEPSVVKITSVSGTQEAVGSGDILTSNGYIVTNDHVVAGYTTYTVTLSNGRSYAATLAGQDAQDDLAVLKINATGLKPIAFANSSAIQVGEFAVAVGNPLDLQESATLGTVSAVNGTATEAPSGPASELTGLLQTTATIAPGNSGGALVNLQGQLLGIPTLEETNPDTNSASGIGYAIPANRVEYVVSQLMQYGKLQNTGQGFLGVASEDVTPQIAAASGLSASSGVLVTGFAQDATGQSPAQVAGLKAGDVITAIDGQAVTSGDDLAGSILTQAPGTKVTVTVLRGTSQLTLTVTLGQRPANG